MEKKTASHGQMSAKKDNTVKRVGGIIESLRYPGFGYGYG